ncbi:hypothetical protein Sjap_006446 [Stephania japonica]|uniref:Uncharacterized protein n=1 Tax=Stephania japonica TaxID=461633 RepID=A0AAP0PIX5_9MAGN
MDGLPQCSTQHNHKLKVFIISLIPFHFPLLELAKMPREKKLLKDIDPNSVNWYADVYVLEKLPVKQGSTSSVQQQRLILVDEEGYQIQATIFGNDINLFESRLQTKVAYRISNAFVKKIEPRYRIVPSPHQWSISRSTLIRQLPDSETFPLLEEAKFVTLEEIDDYLDTDESIDVAVLALIAKPRRHVAKRNGQPACLQELIVVDECCMPIRLTLWDEFATRIGPSIEDIIAKTPVLVCRRLKVAYHSGICIATRPSSTIDLVDDSGRAQALRQGELINNDGLSIPLNFRSPMVRPSQRRPLVTIAKITSMLSDQTLFCLKVAISVSNVEQALWFMSCNSCSKFTNAEVGEVFYCTNCKHEDAHGTPRARVEVELTDESGALKVMAYGSIAEDIISLSAKEIMTKTKAIEASKLMATSKLLKSASSFYVYVQADKIVDKTVNRFFLVGISPIKEEVHEQDLNGGGGNGDGLPSANAQTSHLPQPMPCNTKKWTHFVLPLNRKKRMVKSLLRQ